MCAAIILENIDARMDDDRLLLPAGPGYTLRDEVKSIITVVAKTHHYWQAHVAGTGRVPGFPVKEVIDTVGAGDGFAAGVISALLEGRSVPEAVRRGSWIGARAVQVLGDTEGLPTRTQLEEAGL